VDIHLQSQHPIYPLPCTLDTLVYDGEEFLTITLAGYNMSNLYRSAVSARLAKLPQDLPPGGGRDEGNEEDEAADIIGALPGSGMGPPAMYGIHRIRSLI
jgi:hypothetical protein